MVTGIPQPDVLPLARMARRLGVTQTWLRSEADAGRVPCLRADRRYLFSSAAVDAILSARAAQEGVARAE